ncbi:MAG: hypothetical protein WBJ37_03080 [Bacteroidales bacterium]
MKQDHVRVEEGRMLNESKKKTCENCIFGTKSVQCIFETKPVQKEWIYKCEKTRKHVNKSYYCKDWAPAK